MSTEVGKAAAQNLMQVIEKTKPQEILELDLVKKDSYKTTTFVIQATWVM